MSEAITYFETRNEMLKYYCSTITMPKVLEIGIFKGEFFDFLINECTIGAIDGVDLFDGVVASGNVDGNYAGSYDIRKSLIELTTKYKEASNIHLYKSDSKLFLQSQKDNTYDIIYIDGDHSYNGVKQDLINSYNKIKDGGYIMGHDYEMNMKKAHHHYDFGVKKAVDEFCNKYKQNIISKALDGCVSFCIKIKKIL
jgi:hypothetical protein